MIDTKRDTIFGMTTQIAIRLPDELVEFIDNEISAGKATSRAAVVARVLKRERQRKLNERDAAIYAAHQGKDPDDLAELLAWTAEHPIDLGD